MNFLRFTSRFNIKKQFTFCKQSFNFLCQLLLVSSKIQNQAGMKPLAEGRLKRRREERILSAPDYNRFQWITKGRNAQRHETHSVGKLKPAAANPASHNRRETRPSC